MKIRHIFTVVFFVLSGFAGNLFSQSGRHSLTRENISLVVPDDWLATKLGKKMGDFGLRLKKQNDVAFVEINCTRHVAEPTSKITTLASERSNKETFEYMQIDEVRNAKLGKMNAELLVYTNTHLTDSYRGGIYGLVDNGYTYTIEFYGADTPEGRKEIESILKSLKIDKPLAEENMVVVEEEFVPKDWNVVQEDETEAVVSDNDNTKKDKVKAPERKLSKEEKKLEKEKEKRLKEETKKVEKKKKELEKKKKQKAKDDKRAAEKKKKAMKAKKDDSEVKEALRKAENKNEETK